MKKIIKIGMILIVLLSMVGFASASAPNVIDGMEIDINTNAVSSYIVTYSPATSNSNVTFAIFVQDTDGTWTIPTSEIEGKLEGGNWLSADPIGVKTSNIVGGLGTWNFDVKDRDQTLNENDISQIGKEYMVFFYCDTEPIGQSQSGMVTSIVTGVPEFPTIALPIAAVLGLAFIIQRRREED